MPYAIIKTGGKQFRVEPAARTRFPRSSAKRAARSNSTTSSSATTARTSRRAFRRSRAPSVTGEIVRHGRGDKIIVFKQKRRKNYARKRGHRQGFTEVRINDISLG